MTPASIRNRNPSAMYPCPSSKKFGSTSYETLRSKDGVHKIATFPTSEHGAAAQFDLLLRVYAGMTVKAAITRWSGGHYVDTYLGVLQKRAGIASDTVLTKERLSDPDFALRLAKAMAWQEAGRDYPMDDEGWLEGHQMAFGTVASAPNWSPENDVPTPKPETRQSEAVKAIAKHPATIVAAGGSAATALSEVVSSGVPSVPDVAAKSLENASAWRKLVTGVYGIGNELVGVAMMTGKLWPYALVAGVGASGLGYVYWKRKHEQAG